MRRIPLKWPFFSHFPFTRPTTAAVAPLPFPVPTVSGLKLGYDHLSNGTLSRRSRPPRRFGDPMVRTSGIEMRHVTGGETRRATMSVLQPGSEGLWRNTARPFFGARYCRLLIILPDVENLRARNPSDRSAICEQRCPGVIRRGRWCYSWWCGPCIHRISCGATCRGLRPAVSRTRMSSIPVCSTDPSVGPTPLSSTTTGHRNVLLTSPLMLWVRCTSAGSRSTAVSLSSNLASVRA